MLTRLRFTLGLVVLLLLSSAMGYSQYKAKHGDTGKRSDWRTVHKSTSVYSTHSKPCPACSGTINGYKYKYTGHREKRWEYVRFNANKNTWEVTGYSEWEYQSTVTVYSSSINWNSICNGGNPRCRYGYGTAFLSNPLIYSVGGYYV